MDVLLGRFSAPEQSWGSQSRFIERDTGREVTKSGAIGLLCAALGKPREERPGDGFPTLAELSSLRFGVRVDREGIVIKDFQTAGGGQWVDGEYGVVTADGKRKLNPVVSNRYYLSDAVFLVGFEGDPALIERLDRALEDPVWPLFLGRKACVPGEPVRLPGGSIRKGISLEEALSKEPWLLGDWGWIARKKPEQLRVVIDGQAEDGDIRQDVPLSFSQEDRLYAVKLQAQLKEKGYAK